MHVIESSPVMNSVSFTWFQAMPGRSATSTKAKGMKTNISMR